MNKFLNMYLLNITKISLAYLKLNIVHPKIWILIKF